MGNQKEVKLSYWAAHLTTIVSVTLVLIILGVIALITLGANQETRKLRGSLEMSVILRDSVSDIQGDSLAKTFATKTFAQKVDFISSAKAMAAMSAEVGEDLEKVLGVNFLSPEINITLRPEYSTPAKIAMVQSELGRHPMVEQALMPDSEMVESMNSNIRRLSWILGAIAVVMTVISIVLIHNTVRLSIYSRRFTIHTMQLVGATNGFIRRPFVVNNMLCGLLAAVLACGLLAGALAFVNRQNYLPGLVSWDDFGLICVTLLVVAVLICALSSAVATTLYLRKDYAQLFR